ncbi:MAG: alpha/beta fold hydrolase [Acidimicrobiia bacterium]|nr:alpha/beta fold hydrolase [Acidimicrobiia bacterium]
MDAPSGIDHPPSMVGTATSPLIASAEDGRTIELHWTRHDPPGGGDPERLLLINGLGSPLVSFDEGFVAELVDRGFSVVRFDNRDAGRSGRVFEDRNAHGYHFDRPPYTLIEMARDVVAVLDAVGWDAAHLLGQSMGGMIAQQVAISHPDRARSLTSFMSSTGNPDHGRATDEAHAALIRPAPRDREAWIAYTVETARLWATPDSWDPEAVRRRAARKFDYGIDVFGTGRQFRAILASGDRDDELSRLTVPTLVIHGSADTLIQPDGGRHTAALIPGARYVELEGLGHDLPPSRWALLADTVTSFVADLNRSV